MKRETLAKLQMATACVLYGTLGIMRRAIPLTSGLISFFRAVTGSCFLIVFLYARKKRLDFPAIRRNLRMLIPAGLCMGAAWVLLFEAYNHTTVAVATLSFYLAPTIVILASPVVLHEKLTAKKLVCAAVALVGMVLISGVTGASFQGMRGILYALLAAVLYATNTLLGKRLKDIPPVDTAAVELFIAALILAPWLFATGGFSGIALTPRAVLLLFVLGIVHTSFAYTLHFASLAVLDSHTVSMLGYIDPITAVALSALVLKEPLTVPVVIGAVMILASAFVAGREDNP